MRKLAALIWQIPVSAVFAFIIVYLYTLLECETPFWLSFRVSVGAAVLIGIGARLDKKYNQ